MFIFFLCSNQQVKSICDEFHVLLKSEDGIVRHRLVEFEGHDVVGVACHLKDLRKWNGIFMNDADFGANYTANSLMASCADSNQIRTLVKMIF